MTRPKRMTKTDYTVTQPSTPPVALVSTRLRAIEPAHRRKKVQEALDDHFQCPSRRDGRGRRSDDLKEAARTLAHIGCMPRWVASEDYDLNHRRRIKDVLKHIDHRVSWEQIVEECKEARGLANKAGQARNERKEYGPSEVTRLYEDYTSIRLNTIETLRAAGRRGDNCLRDNHFDYHDALRNGQTEFYEIRKADSSVAWMSVDSRSREVDEIKGPSNDEPEIAIDVLWALCRRLRVSGDQNHLFTRSRVLSMFVSGAADLRRPDCVVFAYRLWWRPHEIALHDSKNGGWSRFEWNGSGWEASDFSHLDTDALVVLQRASPKVGLIALLARIGRKGRRSR